jgi:hypothetical protein
MPHRSILVAVALLATCCLIVFAKEPDSPLKLWKLIVLNRHGHRAPNPPYWSMCPNDAYNRKNYDVLPEDLTGIGMMEEFRFGQFLRSTYGDLIGLTYDRERFYMRTVGVPRCIQSGMAIAEGLFPAGFGPRGFLPGRPQLVTVFSDLDMHEYLIDDTPCWGQSGKDQKDWYRDYFPRYMAEPVIRKSIDDLIKICGAKYPQTDDDMALFVKIVVDGVVFNHDFGLEVLHGKVSKELMFNLRNISIRFLRGRLYETDTQKTYGVMDFPNQLIHAAGAPFTEAAFDDFMHPLQPVQVFVAHREELYGYDSFFGIKTLVDGLPPGELPVASSYLFEILRQEDKTSNRTQTYIKTTLWTPVNGEYSVAVPGCRSPRLCTVEELSELVAKRTARTGTWRKICNYPIV